jgi:F-box-like
MTDPPFIGGVDQFKAEETSVYSKLNELVSISSLPAEILEHIFDFCVSWIYDYKKTKHCLAWTQVCFSWRSISFNSSRLWQRIDLCNPHYADQFLVRSKEAPLSVVSTSPPKLTTDNLALHAGRLHSIDVFLFPGDMAHLFSSIGGSLTNLVNLSLKVPQASSALLLDIPLPRVRRLALDCIAVPWNNCHDLTHLSLRGLDAESCPSIPQLHQLLAQSPCIELIRLENLRHKNLLSDDNLTQPLCLPHLKDMIVSSEPLAIIALLSGMLVSANTRLQLYFSLSESLHSIFPHGIPQMKVGHRLDASTIRLSRHSVRFILNNTQHWSEDSSRSLLSISSASHVAIHICKSLDHLQDAFRITTLELNTGVLFDIPNHHMHHLLASLTNLEALSIAFNDLEEILKILSTVQPPLLNLLCPCLVEVSFGKPADMWWQFSERWLDSIIGFARVRRHYSLPIHRFEFFQCHGIADATVEILEEIVPLVKISELTLDWG